MKDFLFIGKIQNVSPEGPLWGLCSIPVTPDKTRGLGERGLVREAAE